MAHHDRADRPAEPGGIQRASGRHAQSRAASAGDRFAVLCLDLDRFKEVNDVFGHAVGDSLLQEVARRLRATAQDIFLARLGGDEFTLDRSRVRSR